MVMYDIIIKNGLIVTGDDSDTYQADIGIKDDKISKIGDLSKEDARGIIDASSKIVCPGFIDMHAHDEIDVLREGVVKAKLSQGITTVVNGNCGFGFFPLNEKSKQLLLDYNSSLFDLRDIQLNWDSLKGYTEELNKRGLSFNVANLVGHGALRIAVMGFSERKASKQEIHEMIVLLKQAISEGALGLSSGLLYPPSSYADRDEILSLCEVLADNNCLYTTHMRNESDKIVECIQENIDIAKETGVSVEISHINVSGEEYWGKSKEIVKVIEEARDAGININCDQYPYQAGSTFLTALLPQWTLNQGIDSLISRLKENTDSIKESIKNDILTGIDGWDNIIKSCGWDKIVINSVSTEKNQIILGKSIEEIARLWQMDCFSVLFKLLVEEEGIVTVLIFSVCDEDFYRFLKSPFIMIGTDGLNLDGKPHPRLYGTYPRILNKFVKEEKKLSLKAAIRKMTSLPSEKLGLKGRGQLKENYYADIVIFDYENVKDIATYSDPLRYAQGIERVLVNGHTVYCNGEFVEEKCGMVLVKE